MKTTREHNAREEDVPTCLTTTLYDLMTALQAVVEPHEDALVVAMVTRWLQTGRITLLGKAAARRRAAMQSGDGAVPVGFSPVLDHVCMIPWLPMKSS